MSFIQGYLNADSGVTDFQKMFTLKDSVYGSIALVLEPSKKYYTL